MFVSRCMVKSRALRVTFERMSDKLASTALRMEGASVIHRHDAAVVYVNHRGARIVFLDGPDLVLEGVAVLTLGEHHNRFRMRDRSETGRFGKVHPAPKPLHDALVNVIGRCSRVLVVGSGLAKGELMLRLSQKRPDLAAQHVVGTERAGRLTDAQLAALGRKRIPAPTRAESLRLPGQPTVRRPAASRVAWHAAR
jgi:hypothetical protein